MFYNREEKDTKKREPINHYNQFSFLSPTDGYMIIQNRENVKSISQMINEYEGEPNLIGVVCPCCKSTEFIYYGTYKRNVIYLENGHINESRLGIKRVLCKKCYKTHAIIPSFLIPYKQHSLNTVLILLEGNENTDTTTIALENKYEVSRQLVLIWKKQFQKYLSKIYIMYINFDTKEVIKLLQKETNIIKKYYVEYREIFMMRRRQIFYSCIPT